MQVYNTKQEAIKAAISSQRSGMLYDQPRSICELASGKGFVQVCRWCEPYGATVVATVAKCQEC